MVYTELPKWNFNEIIEAQKNMGMTDADIQEAEKMAREFVEKLTNDTLDPEEDRLLDIRNPNF